MAPHLMQDVKMETCKNNFRDTVSEELNRSGYCRVRPHLEGIEEPAVICKKGDHWYENTEI